VASRYVQQGNWDAAIEVLYGGAAALLKAGQGASGGDLGGYLVEVYVRGGKGVGGGEKGLWGIFFWFVCLFVVCDGFWGGRVVVGWGLWGWEMKGG